MRTPKSKGSVGREIPSPISIFRTLIATGVRKTIKKISLSRKNIYRMPMMTATGIRMEMKKYSLRINTTFSMTKSMLKI
jgi:hypothetical protein